MLKRIVCAAAAALLALPALADVQHGDDWDAASSARQVKVVAGTVSVTEPVSVDDGAGSLTVDGTVTVTDGAGDLTVDGTVAVSSVPAPLSTSGGGLEATALRVTIASDSTGLVSVDGSVDVATLPNVTLDAASQTQVVGSTGAVGGAPLAGLTTIVSNCAANGTTTFTPTAGTYEVCSLTSGSDVAVHLCYTDDGGSGTDCATLGEPFGATILPTCKVRRLANVPHYCRGDATADFEITLLTY